MKITRDNNNNVSYTLETNDIYAQQIIDYWTPEKKAKAIPIMPCIEDEIEQPNITTTDPEIADLKQMPFQRRRQTVLFRRWQKLYCQRQHYGA